MCISIILKQAPAIRTMLVLFLIAKDGTGSLFIPYEATNILVLLMFCERDILTGLMVQPVRSN